MSNPNVIPPHQKKLGVDLTLQEVLGDKYDEFIKRMELHEPLTVIARAVGKSRSSIARYVKVYRGGE